ncbi:hypothetical protein [Actinomadura fibrosa]|uniref:Uncharacterized protein n=1 Tax=Actinomadura fibrosa TaxID=111802 RepID=A0ABW2XN21_9ACTN|nr:hypothetical protein [Actinomadura fibrosa]
MARRRTRDQTRNAWWAGMAVLTAIALFAQIWQLWIIPVLAWIVYELCYCPTNCGVQTNHGEPCRNHANGRLYACSLTVHRRMKNRALLELLPIKSARYRGTADSETPGMGMTEQAVLEPHQRLMVYLIAVVSMVMTIQLVLTIMALL